MQGGEISASGLTGQPGGTVYIRAGQLAMGSLGSDIAGISAHTRGSSNGADVGIDIGLRGKLILSGGEIAASSYGAGKAGDIKVSAASVEVGGDPIYSSSTSIGSRTWSSGHGGNRCHYRR